ncbi:hypothetical protein [Endothiovibrio diazotrophicus]
MDNANFRERYPVIPFYCHPTTVCVIDSAREALELTALHFPRMCRPRVFDDPQRLQEVYRQALRPAAADAGDAPVYGDPRDPRRFDLITLLFSDYELRGDDGVALARRLLRLYPLKGIIYSATARVKKVRQAVEAGYIDRFIPKYEEGASLRIPAIIEELNREWFIDNVAPAAGDGPAWRRDPVCAQLLEEQLAFSRCSEFYIYRDGRGLLLLGEAPQSRYDLLFDDAAEVAWGEEGVVTGGITAGIGAQRRSWVLRRTPQDAFLQAVQPLTFGEGPVPESPIYSSKLH